MEKLLVVKLNGNKKVRFGKKQVLWLDKNWLDSTNLLIFDTSHQLFAFRVSKKVTYQ